ncbi:BOUP1-like protein [Beauveria bassiana ARSEF 2860]|uniref:BOUP1-like protein n=1 Tax=Beauveria bassiana (strain ARSEF 2860) TaxID=655819 RepID=J4KRA5_BEAB2|nr:BOUP1-like protein [Beauveria bassiana ARSEF 2860]EJP70614.1 BOUP1-like protein [Beauveria bassiana ARSEF 2860]
MPLWKINHSVGIFTNQADKDAIAKKATEWYQSVGLPAFYVHTLFVPFERENGFTGGKPHAAPYVLLEVAHIARNWEGNKKAAEAIKRGIDGVMKPFTTDKGIHLEYAVLEGPAALWRIDGVDPPEAFGPDQQEQAAKNRKILADKYRSLL